MNPLESVRSNIIISTYFDWFGNVDLEKYKKQWQKACEETEGIKSTKLYASHQARYHYVWLTKVKTYADLMEAWSKIPDRDRNIMTHAVFDVLSES